jgi:hypothetical protein
MNRCHELSPLGLEVRRTRRAIVASVAVAVIVAVLGVLSWS